eukprot:2285127-Pyramimonas_sp.AAC.1
MVCPELADALKPVPPKAPEVLLEQHAACLRRLQCQTREAQEPGRGQRQDREGAPRQAGRERQSLCRNAG